MKIEDELYKCGARITVTQFEELLIYLLEDLYPGHSIDALLCDPHLALRFCEYVRMESRATTLPSETILRRLTNMRKRGVAPATKGVKSEVLPGSKLAAGESLELATSK